MCVFYICFCGGGQNKRFFLVVCFVDFDFWAVCLSFLGGWGSDMLAVPSTGDNILVRVFCVCVRVFPPMFFFGALVI